MAQDSTAYTNSGIRGRMHVCMLSKCLINLLRASLYSNMFEESDMSEVRLIGVRCARKTESINTNDRIFSHRPSQQTHSAQMFRNGPMAYQSSIHFQPPDSTQQENAVEFGCVLSGDVSRASHIGPPNACR